MSVQSVNQPYFEDIASAIREKQGIAPSTFAEATALPGSSYSRCIAYGAGKWVVAGLKSTNAWYSTNGTEWTSMTVPVTPTNMFFADGRFFAHDLNTGNCMISEDGLNWASGNMGATGSGIMINDATWGDGKYVAVRLNGKCYVSTDGLSWVTRTISTSISGWTSVTYGNGKFVAVRNGYSSAAYSEDGSTWYTTTLSASAAWQSVSYGNGKFVASANNTVAVSTDGTSWNTYSFPISSIYAPVVYAGGCFIGAGQTTFAYSYDGSTWKTGSITNSYSWTHIAYGNGKFLLLSYKAPYVSASTISTIQANYFSGEISRIAADSASKWVAKSAAEYYNWGKCAAGDGYVASIIPLYTLMWMKSPDGTFSEHYTPSSGTVSGIAYGNGRFFILHSGKDIADYYDVLNGSWASIGLTQDSKWVDVAYGDGKFVAIASNSQIANVFDFSGSRVTSVSGSTGVNNMVAITYGAGKFVAISGGQTTTSNTMAYSSDGINWTTATLPYSVRWMDVCYGNGKFVAVSRDGQIVYSNDGITWTRANGYDNSYEWWSVTYGGGMFIAVQDSEVSITTHSVDGVNWEKNYRTDISQKIRSQNVCYDNGAFYLFPVGSTKNFYTLTLPSSAWGNA